MMDDWRYRKGSFRDRFRCRSNSSSPLLELRLRERDYELRKMNESDVVRVREKEYRVMDCGDGGSGREFDMARVGDRRDSPRGREVEGGGRTRVGDWRHSLRGREGEVLRDGREGSGREFDMMRVGDRRDSPRRREVEVVRDGRDDFGGREYDRMGGCDRSRSPRGRKVEVLRDGREDRGGRGYDMVRVCDRSISPRGREVEFVRDDRDYFGGREYDRMRVCDRSRSPRGRKVEVLRDGREDGGGGDRECDMMTVGDLRCSSRGREMEDVRDGRENMGGGGRECDRTRVGDWRCSPRGREVEVVRDGREYQKGRFDDGESSLGEREMGAAWSSGEHERQIVHSHNQREMKATCIGDEYDGRIAEMKYSLMLQEVKGMRSVKEYEGSCMLDQESPMVPVAKNRLMDEHIPEQVRLRRDYDRAPPDVANRGKNYDGTPPDVANRRGDYDRAPPDVPNRARDYNRSPPDVANRGRDYDRAPPDLVNRGRNYDGTPPDVANRGGDYDRPPPDVADRGRDYDRAPPDVANRGRDDGGLPRNMRVSHDDRGIERDNGNNIGLLERNYFQFDDSLFGMGSNSMKFQNNILEERGKADTFRSNRKFSDSDGRLCCDLDNIRKQSLDVGLLERFLDTDHMMLNSDSGRRSLSLCPSDTMALSKHFGVTSRGHLLTPRLDNTVHKHVDGDRYLNKLIGDGPFMGDRTTLELLKDEYDYIPSSSLSKAFSTMPSDGYREELSPLLKETGNIGPGGVVLSCGISGKPLMDDAHCQKSLLGSSIIYARQCNHNGCSSLPYLTLPEEHKSSAYQEVGRCEDNHIGTGSCDTYGNSHHSVDNYCCQDMSRAQHLELNVDRETYQFNKQDRSLDDSQQWDLDPYSIRHSMPDYVNAVRSSHLKKQDMDILDYGDSHLQYDIRIHDDFGPNQHLEYHDHRKVDGPHCHHNRSEIVRSGKYFPKLNGHDRSPTKKLFLHNLNLSQPSEMMLRHRHLTGNLQSAQQTIDEIYVKQPYSEDELDFLPVSRKSKYRSSSYEKTGNGCRDLSSELTNRNLSQPLATVLSKDTRSSGRDIKSRLGPSPQNAHASRSVAKKLKSSVKKRLGHGPDKNHATLPWIKNLNAPKVPRIQKDSDGNHYQGEEILEGNASSRRVDPNLNAPKFSKLQQCSEGHLDQGGNSLEVNEIARKDEPPENSEKFKQLVHTNFFKYVGKLNETLVRRRRFMENGKCGSLKCLVCGSDSPEFQDTESLVMHALSYDKIGSKCQHLGFHKALCALMGWRSAEVLNDWVCERLSDAETSALKDDLIIWPPVVVVHNITTADIQEKRITLSVEEFESKLRDMGFDEKTKVSLGRPADQDTMVVSFGQSFSALQEAERLHKIFLDFNRGRTGVLQLHSNSSENYPGELPVASGNELHPFLYGYIGLADDLDKLDFKIKWKSRIKSKMEIRVTEDALVKKEVTADATNKKEAIADATVN